MLTLVLAIHLFALIAWMVVLLYLPRLFVYHVDTLPEQEADSIFRIMERRLLQIIGTPAMLLTWLSGLTLAFGQGFLGEGWLHGKLMCVALLTAFHFWLASLRKAFLAGKRPVSARALRWLNEIPSVLLVIILLLVLFKPF